MKPANNRHSKYFAGRVVVITGAANGIGRGFARQLNSVGARVAALDRDAARLEDLAGEMSYTPFITAVADVTDFESLKTAVSHAEQGLGPIDILIANAGIARETSATSFREDLFADEVRINLIGVANSMAAVLPGMLSRGRGQLAALSSIASYRGFPLLAGYSASKAGVRSLCDAFRVELRPRGILVTTICPGGIETGIVDQLDIPEMPPRLSVTDAVNRMLTAIARGRTLYTFPAREAWLVRFLRYLPIPVSDWIVARKLAELHASRRRAADR